MIMCERLFCSSVGICPPDLAFISFTSIHNIPPHRAQPLSIPGLGPGLGPLGFGYAQLRCGMWDGRGGRESSEQRTAWVEDLLRSDPRATD